MSPTDDYFCLPQIAQICTDLFLRTIALSRFGGQDSLDSSDSCSKKTHPHGKIRVHLCHLWENNYL